jgi:hypothetical protein
MLPGNGLAQDSMMLRRFVFEDQLSNDPIQLVGFRVGGEMVGSGTVFQASNEAWLRDSFMIVKNVSKREAVHIVVFLFFPETGGSKPMVGDQIAVGVPPPEGQYTHEGKKLNYPEHSDVSLLPGQTLEVPLGPHFAGYSALIRKTKPLEDLTVCHVRFVNVYFANGMKWSPNYFGRPDPDHVGQYIRILPSEFYEYHPAAKSN